MEMELRFLADVLLEKSSMVLMQANIIYMLKNAIQVVSQIITLFFACFYSNTHALLPHRLINSILL